MKKLLAIAVTIGISGIGCSQSPSDEGTLGETYTDPMQHTRLANGFNGNPAIWPEIDSEVKVDAALEARVDAILQNMTLEHKVAQMVQGELRHVRPEHVLKYRLGSVLNGGGSHPNGDRYASVDDWLAIADGYWEASTTDDLPHEPIPLIWGTDAVHGHNNVLGAVLFPHNFGLGAAGNPELMRGIGRATAEQVIATGIDWTFAPTVAVAMDYQWGRSYESYGQNPDMVRDYAYEMVAAIQGGENDDRFGDGHIIATIKHFVGDGGTAEGIDQGETTLSEQALFDVHAQGYVGGLTAGAQTVMASFNSWNGDKLHGHHYMLTTVLKERMGFDGFVVGDWNGHGHLPGCSNAHCASAINAGVDMIMVPDDWEAFLLNTIDDVNAGIISQERVDDAVRRILRVKMRAGMFDTVKPSERHLAGSEDVLWGDDVKALSRDAVRQSLVLLKNEDETLPLNGGERVLVIGNATEDIARQMGGWSITWQGTETSVEDFPNATKISDAIVARGAELGSEVVVSSDVADLNGEFDKIIVLFGESPYAEFNGDRSHIVYNELDTESLALLQAAKATGKPVVGLFISGRPMFANPEINASDAFVAAWLPGSEGQGVSDVLWGDFDFTGRLPGTWPLSSSDDVLPIGAGGTYQTVAPITAMLDESYEIDVASEILDIFTGTYATNVRLDENQVSVGLIDRVVQEDARRVSFNAEDASVAFSFDGPLNQTAFRRYDARVKFMMRTVQADAEAKLILGMSSQMPMFELDAQPLLAQTSEWREWSIPLYCLAPDVASLASVESPLLLQASEGVVIEIAEVRWEFGGSDDYDCANTWAGDNHREPVFVAN